MAPTIGGHVRIENRLFEAIIAAAFTDLQRALVLVVYRQTQGWQQQCVRASHADLTHWLGLAKVSGGFRSALRELREEGVLPVVDAGGGADPNVYQLQHDFQKWGRFSIATAALEARFGQRPDHPEQLPLAILTVGRTTHPDSGESGSATDTLTLQGQAPRLPRVIPPDSPESGSQGPTPPGPTSSDVGKPLKDSETQPQRSRRVSVADAMTLLLKLEALQENVGGISNRVTIRRDRIKAELGDDIDTAVQMLGIERLLSTKPEHRGILTRDLAAALTQVRSAAA